MFSWYRKFAAMPMAKRLLWVAPFSLVCFLIVIKLTVFLWVEAAVDAVSEENTIEYDSTFFRLNGDFGVSGFKLVHLFPDGEEGPTYLADRVVVHTPGLLWLLMGSFSDPDDVPDAIGLTAENFRDATRTDVTPGNYTNLPYDAIGCGVKLLTPGDLHAMGLPSARNASLSLRRLDDANSNLLFEVRTPDVGQLQMSFDLTVPRPLPWNQVLVAMLAAHASNISMSMKDLGFTKVRNDFCARKGGVPASGFSDFHMQSLSNRFAEEGLHSDSRTLDRYREFARDGGELTISSVNAPSRSLMKFVGLSRFEKLQVMPAVIRHDDGPATEFVFDIGPVTRSVPVALSTAAAASTAGKATAALGAPGGVIPYTQLKSMIGAHVEFATLNGTIRRGTLLSYSPYLSVLKLDPGEGGFTLSVPVDSIAQVTSMPLGIPAETGQPR